MFDESADLEFLSVRSHAQKYYIRMHREAGRQAKAKVGLQPITAKMMILSPKQTTWEFFRPTRSLVEYWTVVSLIWILGAALQPPKYKDTTHKQRATFC